MDGEQDAGGLDSAQDPRWSHGAEDLSTEWSLEGCPKIEFEGREYPSLGRNAVLSLIGKGSMGYVYFGVNPRLESEVAIKVLPRSLLESSEDLRARFRREAQFAARLNSHHLVRVHDVDEDTGSGCYYIVMEYVRGISASRWRDQVGGEERHGVSEDRALEVVIAATKGLAAAHSQGIVHRDVKPGNILIPFDEEEKPLRRAAKLSDLGLARTDASDQNLTGAQATMGTPGYMSPEQTISAKEARAPSDIFAMGATLYNLLTGRRPFEGAGPSDVLLRTSQGDFTPVRQVKPEVSKATAAVIDRCLKVDPADRYPDASSLLVALEQCATSPAAVAARAPDDMTQPISALGPDIGDTTTLREEDLGLLAPSLEPLPDESGLFEEADFSEAPVFESPEGGAIAPPAYDEGPAFEDEASPPPTPAPPPPSEAAGDDLETFIGEPVEEAGDDLETFIGDEEPEWEVPAPDEQPQQPPRPPPLPPPADGQLGDDDETMMPAGDVMAAALAAAKASIGPSDYGEAARSGELAPPPRPPPLPPPEDGQLGDDDETMMPAQDAVAAALAAAQASLRPSSLDDAPPQTPSPPPAAPPPARPAPEPRSRPAPDPMESTSDQVASALDRIGVKDGPAAPPESENRSKLPFVILTVLLLAIAGAAFVFFYM